MKIKYIISTVLMMLCVSLWGQTLSVKTCKTCGKPLTQCQYRGKHPSVNTAPVSSPSQVQVLSGIDNGHEWVDLGLPSGTKWATCNIGAAQPSDYGGFYAWGEISQKSYYDWNNYFDCINGEVGRFNTFSIIAKSIILYNSGYDVAYSSWGGGWRLPTKEQSQELIDCCTWEWAVVNQHYGYIVKSRTNSSSIFLPASGYKWTDNIRDKDSFGAYWSSRIKEDDSNSAYGVSFHDTRVSNYDGYVSRACGRNVRAVCIKQ